LNRIDLHGQKYTAIPERVRAFQGLRAPLPSSGATIQSKMQADVAQLVEQLIRNQQVVSSSLTVGSRIRGLSFARGQTADEPHHFWWGLFF
jgi:hypothetical protein